MHSLIHKITLILVLIVTLIVETKCHRIQDFGNNYYKIIQEEVPNPGQQQQPNLTSFCVDVDGSTVFTLEMTSGNQITLDSYLFPSMQLVNRTDFIHDCEQAFIVTRDTFIC